MPHHCWLFDVVKGHAVWSTAVFSQLDWPLLVVFFVPVFLWWCWRLPCVVRAWRKRMESLASLLVPCVNQTNVEHFVETLRNFNILLRSVLVRRAAFMVEPFGDILSKCTSAQNRPGPTRVEVNGFRLSKPKRGKSEQNVPFEWRSKKKAQKHAASQSNTHRLPPKKSCSGSATAFFK